MSTKPREVIYGSRIRGAKIYADVARERAKQAVREADRADADRRRSRNASMAAWAGSR